MARFFLRAASVIMLSLSACGHAMMTFEERLATLSAARATGDGHN
jgi:hypothetical protein